jgi:hypothetical protein
MQGPTPGALIFQVIITSTSKFEGKLSPIYTYEEILELLSTEHNTHSILVITLNKPLKK